MKESEANRMVQNLLDAHYQYQIRKNHTSLSMDTVKEYNEEKRKIISLLIMVKAKCLTLCFPFRLAWLCR